MELFEKIYGCYYQVMTHLLAEAAKSPLSQKQMEEIINRYGYQESFLTILPKLKGGSWALLQEQENGTYASLLSAPPKLPLTDLQKKWIQSLLSDPRISLFLNDEEIALFRESLADVSPLFSQADFYYFDQYKDGDPYTSASYREIFQMILKALSQKKALFIAYPNRKLDTVVYEAAPYQLQYSAKDNKFRLLCLSFHHGHFSRQMTLNLGKIKACCFSKKQVPCEIDRLRFQASQKSLEPVEIEISGERNSLERCMLHFANYEKHTEYSEEKQVYLCSIYYDLADETELLIDVLSFGPVIRVLGPEHFVKQIQSRVCRQHDLLYQKL